MNQSLTLPMADKFYHDKQTSAFIRSVNVSWEKPEKDHYYLEYSYNQKDWYALNGGFPIVLPCDELSVTDALKTQDSNGETISVAALSSLQNKYGKPEPVCIQSVERCESDPETVQVTYTNGMKEIRNIIRSEDGIGHIQDNDYAAPIISHRADPYIYKHTDGKYYFLGSHTDAGHNLNGTYQYLYIILRCADTLEDLTDNSGRYTEKVIYEREPIGPDRVSPHLWAPEIHYIQGGWYVYYTTTVSDHSSWRIRPHCLACTGDDPMNDPWITKGPIQTTVENDIAFTDFSLDHTFFHHKGEDYFVWAQKTNNISDIFIAKLSNPWTICTPSVLLTHPEYNWELHGFAVNEDLPLSNMAAASSLHSLQVVQMHFIIWDFYMQMKTLIFWILLPGPNFLIPYSKAAVLPDSSDQDTTALPAPLTTQKILWSIMHVRKSVT